MYGTKCVLSIQMNLKQLTLKNIIRKTGEYFSSKNYFKVYFKLLEVELTPMETCTIVRM